MKKNVVSFGWLEPEQTAELRARLNAAGDGARLEWRKKGEGTAFRVVPVAGSAVRVNEEGDINKSHVCPPWCP